MPTVSRLANNVLRKLPLRLVLTLPFVLQTVGAVTLVGYLSYRSGQQAVADLASQLMQEKGDRIVQNLEQYFKNPKTLLREHQATIKSGILDWQNTSLIQTYFAQQLNIHTDVSGLMLTTDSKDFLAVGHPYPNQLVIRERNRSTGALENYVADLQGNRLYLRDTLPNYDPHVDSSKNLWYEAAKADKDGFWQPVVSLVRGKDDPILMMAYFLPFADSQGKLQGILGTSVYLDRVGEFLHRLQIGKTGQALIVDEKGLLIATSTSEEPFRRDRLINPKETSPPESFRLAAQDSQNSVTRTAAAWSVTQKDSLNHDSHPRGFRLQNKQYFGRVIPFQLDNHIRWTIVVVVPESDFMAQIQANVYRTVMLCGLALLGAIGSGIWTSKRITRSLFRLTQATQSVGAGTLDTPLPATRIAEVESLTASFRRMVMELQQANQLRQNYAQELERQVAEKTALLNEALNVAKIGSWSWNLVSDERWWSPQMYQIVGLNPDDYSSPPDVEITNQNMHPEDRERVNQITREAIEQGISYEIEFRFLQPDGSITYAFSRGLVERNIEGSVTRFWGITQDISDAYRQATQRKLAEEALRQTEKRYRELFEKSVDGIVFTDIEGRFLNCNASYQKMLGYSLEELQRKMFPEITPAKWYSMEVEIVEKQIIGRGYSDTYEKEYIRKDGTVFPVEINAYCQKNEAGQPEMMWAIVRDISERKLAELALQASQARFAGILEIANDAIITVDAKQRITLFNQGAEKMFGYAAWEVLGQPLDLLLPTAVRAIHHQHVTAFRESISTARRMGERGEIVARRQDSTEFPADASISKLEINGEIICTAILRDISDRKQTEIALQSAKEAAEAANRAKSAFLANMSHELRTPLNGILGYTQILQRYKDSTAQQKEGLGIIQQCGDHLLTLINDILDLSKIEAEKIELYPEDFNFPVFLQGIYEIFRLKAAQKSIDLTYLASQQLPTIIHADEKRVRQALMNLLSNAVKFTDRGSVTFQVEVIGNGELAMGNERQITNNQQPITNRKIRFQVEDTGIGIPPEQLAKIFLPFVQVGDSSRYAEGTGLGLAIAQKLVSLMGSQICAESTPGVGSKFWFDLDLPVPSNLIESTPINFTNNIIGYQGKKRKILVVDDRWENCSVLSNLLEPLGFQVTTAANGQEGLEKAIEVQPDVILADLVMPVMDGHEMTRQLRQLPSFQTTTIIAISASAFESDRVHSRESGCNDFLPKPLQTEELLDQIKRYLNLTWIYDQQETGDREGVSTGFVEATPSKMVIPPPEELLVLSQAALIGDISGVEQELLRLQQLNPEYTSFVTRVMKLAEEFEYEQIANLVERYFSASE